MGDWPSNSGLRRAVLIHSLRTAVATVVSLLLPRGLKQPEFYWAPISTIVVLLSPINPMALGWQRFVGTAMGAVLGALIASYFEPNWVVYGIGIFVCGIFSTVLWLHTAYRFAAITLTIILLVPHEHRPWIVAMQRFVEVSVGFAVALLTSLAWPAPERRVK